MSFQDFLLTRIGQGGFSTEDTLASFLPLARQVLAAHQVDRVAPLEGIDALHVEGVALWFEEAELKAPRAKEKAIRTLDPPQRRALNVVVETRVEDAEPDEESQTNRQVNLNIGEIGDDLSRPVYLPNYVAWEHEVSHHDPLTDIFVLGMILASLACELDFHESDSLERFVSNRGNLFRLKPELHPVLAKAIVRMTELSRHRRPQDLQSLIRSLENYRLQDVDIEFDLARIEGFSSRSLQGKQQLVLGKLQERLFEVSRRNRLLHFRQTMQSVNLTYGSVPLSFEVDHIRPDQVLTWDGDFRDEIVQGKKVTLNRHLNFEEAVYLPSVLDRVRAEARRDRAEFGFAQLRIVLCFLRWSNLKENPPERFDSPLVLLPVELTKKKGVKDTYVVEPLSNEAEVNPVVRHVFKQLYGIDLPETIDLSTADLGTLYDFLQSHIQASAPGVLLEKIDRPRIDLVHDRARRRLEQYRRKVRVAGKRVRRYEDFQYSYHADNFHPLGYQIFREKVFPTETRLRAIVQESPAPRHFFAKSEAATTTDEKSRLFYRLRGDEEDNPYAWEFDLCSITLGNFKYRKMSLVQDYTALLSDCPECNAFDSVFSLVPVPVEDDAPATELDDDFSIVPCDPSQQRAIAQGRSGQNYIVQGPPGTGKSQTITNLIADYVVRGQRVLFVCEKRAAIDVVFHRLRQQGLERQCCLIHDSQADKKAFVLDLKESYEEYLREEDTDADAETGRAELRKRYQRELRPLEAFDTAMRTPPSEAETPLQTLLRRAIALQDECPELTELEKESLPAASLWDQHRDLIERFSSALREVQPDGIFAKHPLHVLSETLPSTERPLERVHRGIERSQELVDDIVSALTETGVEPEAYANLESLQALCDYAEAFSIYAQDTFDLLDPKSDASRDFGKEIGALSQKRRELEEATAATSGWKEKLAPEDTTRALGQARRLDAGWLVFLRPSWWSLRRVLKRSYDFARHAVRPTWTQILEELEHEHTAAAEVEKTEEAIREHFRVEGAVTEFSAGLEDARATVLKLPEALEDVHDTLAESPERVEIFENLCRVGEQLQELSAELERFAVIPQDSALEDVRNILEELERQSDAIPDFLHCLEQFAVLPVEFRNLLRRYAWTLPQLEAALLDRAIDVSYRGSTALRRFSERTRARHAGRIDALSSDWFAANAAVLRTRVRERFRENVRVASLPAGQLSAKQKAFKKAYNQGRKELEHEFGKSMRYKSIRVLATDESGMVVRDLKPIWLMSPLSVSDTLPLFPDLFDVVIFDEASQITLEESVPCLFRAKQVIVVGDEMQLPPTSFFSSRRAQEEDQLVFEDEGEVVEYELDSNSLLNHAARNLSSRMLGWHYRSRSEALISFSNWAFYQGELQTIPDEMLTSGEIGELSVRESADAKRYAPEMSRRPISFHFLESGTYERRRNSREATYIAELVREILQRDDRPTLGIVAFSEAQQSEIESALERLAKDDDAFRKRLDAEWEREEEDQFVGLLVKNLENIQGDERDIIILSVCYGYNAERKMRMNFGPINQSGGEKRLNVAFTRAKHHMAVVSSIRGADIRNDYNDGARSLKQYLAYAAAISAGESADADRILRELSVARRDDDEHLTSDVVCEQLAEAMRERGYEADLDVGRSRFRCHVAVKRPGATQYALGILVDTEGYFEEPLVQRDVSKPKLLGIFGWQTTYVLTKDWHKDPQKVLRGIERLLEDSKPKKED